jgi:hypothetical protein
MADDLRENGVVVVRNTVPTDLCQAYCDEAVQACLKYDALPLSMAERNRGNTHRVFLPISVQPGEQQQQQQQQQQRTGFLLPLTAILRSLLQALLSGPVGRVVAETVGDRAKLTGMLFIASDQGSKAQDIHRDGDYGAALPKIVTLFVALHDILDEGMGPTRFIPRTHAPCCFPDGQWLPPTPQNGVHERETMWFPLEAGDTVVMESTLWHAGGANTSTRKRILLSLSFTQEMDQEKEEVLYRLQDFRVAKK